MTDDDERARRHAALAAEAAIARNDPADVAEMQAIAEFMQSLRPTTDELLRDERQRRIGEVLSQPPSEDDAAWVAQASAAVGRRERQRRMAVQNAERPLTPEDRAVIESGAATVERETTRREGRCDE